MNFEKLLKIKALMKKAKPKFQRTELKKRKKLKSRWIKPTGRDNKIRRSIKGKGHLVRVGYGTPKQLKNKNNEGLNEIVIHNINDLEKLSKKDIAIIGRTVGLSNKYKIFQKAKETGISVKNIPTRVKKISSKKQKQLKEKEAKKKSKKTKEIKEAVKTKEENKKKETLQTKEVSEKIETGKIKEESKKETKKLKNKKPANAKIKSKK